ncbi:MAG: hypothetical protein ABI411_03810 [Tahibacter sp.]
MQPLKRNALFCTLSIALAAPLMLLPAPSATAQSFEAYYGENPARDAGQDVKSVNVCPKTGSIVVGSRRVATGTEALVTRVDDSGVTLWQHAYRVGGGSATSANAVVELRDGSGFAVTGSMVRTDTFIYVMRLNCDGKVLWTRVLGNQVSGNRAVGYDILEARNVVAPAPTSDLVVVGDENLLQPAGSVHGRIARLNAAGAVLFNFAYNQPVQSPGLRFRAVTESKSAAGGADDLVVAGSAAYSTTWATDRRGLMFRVRANGAPLCDAVMGNADGVNEDFFGLTGLSVGNFANETVLVGASVPPTAASAQQVYMVRFRAGSCAPMVQAMWRDPQDGATAFDAVETSTINAGVPGSVIAAGTIRGTVTAGDGFSLSANPATLGPNATSMRYSTQSAKQENLVAIDNKRDRFVMSGSTFTDWDGSGDGQDFYLVQTDPNRKTNCVAPWDFSWTPVDLRDERFTPPVRVIQTSTTVDVEAIDAKDEGYCCKLDPN